MYVILIAIRICIKSVIKLTKMTLLKVLIGRHVVTCHSHPFKFPAKIRSRRKHYPKEDSAVAEHMHLHLSKSGTIRFSDGRMPDDCHFPENDEKDDSDLEFDIGHAHSPLMNPNIFSASVNASGMDYDDSSDEAPDEVSFENSKTSALQEIKCAFETIRQQKQKQKEKRQKKQQIFAAEKKQKLDKLVKNKLPDDILNTIASTHQSKNGIEILQSSNEESMTEHAPQPSTSSKKERRRAKLKKLCKPAGELAPKETVDFIPMNSKTTEFHVRVLEKKVDNVVAKAVMLKDLKNKLIFGKAKRREPASRAISKLAKQEVAGLNCRK